MRFIYKWICILYFYFRFGVIEAEYIYGNFYQVLEIKYTDRHGRICGWWAYGSFDPMFPYQGQQAKLREKE